MARYRTATALLLCAALPLAGCGGAQPPGEPRVPSAAPPSASGSAAEAVAVPGEPRDVATGLDVPWSVAPLPDGSALVSERGSARVLLVEPSGSVSEAGTVEGVRPEGEGGLLGLAVPADFADGDHVYAYHTAAEDNRIVRMPYSDGTLGEQEELVTGIPRGANHNGGRLAFGPDGLLYAGTGDAGDRALAQDTGSLGGKILRMTPEGEPAPGNPFDTLVYSYGHRNVQGLAFDPEGRLYGIEFGQDAYDEVNLIEPGGNYGWPEVEGAGGGGDFVDPLLTWTTDEASPSGAAYAGGSLWVAALRGERLWRVPVSGGEAGAPEALLTGEYGRLRAVAAVDGGAALWVTTSNRDGRGEPAGDDDRVLEIPLTE
ncbi:PQQ-dependent sugar dehydrogenase [Allonocardiopsis opalescens]|uniref:Glucose/arabinose dehydrogenase n=1 Tax=Allonocardiopsis opalescens TaxID=1144618 RepID=A0A2T0QE12_9ACTN|nr:PQQ-dependent sugar dehydrogenase [Allonocardiopsis opalescens]PRY02132.1 glucose/arabinose dehydrogenase [Allonocardiopsis opalescens]